MNRTVYFLQWNGDNVDVFERAEDAMARADLISQGEYGSGIEWEEFDGHQWFGQTSEAEWWDDPHFTIGAFTLHPAGTVILPDEGGVA